MHHKPIIIAIFFMLLMQCNKQNAAEPVIGLKCYTPPAVTPELEEVWKKMGVNTIFGTPAVIADSAFTSFCNRQKISRFLIFPVFFDPEYLEKHPGSYAIRQDGSPAIDEWVHFVCPSDTLFRNEKISQLQRQLELYRPDGISFDFIRYFIFWEKVLPNTPPENLSNTCFCEKCMARFCHDCAILMPDNLYSLQEKSAWILQCHPEIWTRWKMDQITAMAESLNVAARHIIPGILINFHILPWTESDFDSALTRIAGQDLRQLADNADMLSPMLYTHMSGRKPEWIKAVVNNHQAAAGKPIIPSIQVKNIYRTDTITSDELSTMIRYCRTSESGSVIFWSWDQLAIMPARVSMIINTLNSMN